MSVEGCRHCCLQLIEGRLILQSLRSTEVGRREHYSKPQKEFVHMPFAGGVTLLQAHVSLTVMDAHFAIDGKLDRRAGVHIGPVQHGLPAYYSEYEVLSGEGSFGVAR